MTSQTWQRIKTMNEYERFMLEWNKIMSRWCILVHNKKLWTIILGIGTKQERIPFLATTSTNFRITLGYLLHSLIFPHSLCIFKDFGMQIRNTSVLAKIFIFQKWVLFPIWHGKVRTIESGWKDYLGWKACRVNSQLPHTAQEQILKSHLFFTLAEEKNTTERSNNNTSY